MTKSAFITAMIVLFSTSAWTQNANSVENAVQLGYTCRELTVNGLQNVSLTKKLNVCNHLEKIRFTNNSLLTIEDGLYLPSVTHLDLTGTYVNTWELPLISAAFPNLKVISFSNCGFYQIGSSLAGFTELESLDLSDNQLSLLPDDVQLLTNLKTLDVTNNRLTVNIGVIGYLWQLETLFIAGNEKLSSTAIGRILSLNQNLRTISMDYTGSLPAAISMMSETSIETLIFSGNSIKIPAELASLKHLEKIGFINCQTITDSDNTLKKCASVNSFLFRDSEIPAVLVSDPKINTVEVVAQGTQLESNLAALGRAAQLDTIDLSGSFTATQQISALKKQLPGATIISSPTLNLPGATKPITPILPAAITVVKIEPAKENTVEVENVEFAIPENAFLDQNGNAVTGPVKLEITVYNDPIEIALAGAPMTFNNNGKREIFSSQGMLRFDAFDQNGNALQANPENLITVSMPNLQPNTDGNLYAYNEEMEEWETVDEPKWGGLEEIKSSQTKLDSINRIDYKSMIRIEDDEPIYILKTNFDRNAPYLEFRVPKKSQLSAKTGNGIYRYQQKKNKVIAGQRFYIDTIVSRREFHKLKHAYKGYTSKSRKIKSEEAYYNEPRVIWNTQITPDPETDALRLSFNLKDSSYSFPVSVSQPYTSQNWSLRSSRNASTKFEFERRLAFAHDSLIKDKLDRDMARIRDSLAINLKNQAILSNGLTFENQQAIAKQMSRLGFGLGSFGLVNCDFFLRNTVSSYAAIDTVVVDQNNVEYQTAPTVRVIYTDDNAYIEQSSSEVCLISSSKEIGIMILSSTLIGIVEFVENATKKIRKIKTINIEGKSPEEVSQLIRES